MIVPIELVEQWENELIDRFLLENEINGGTVSVYAQENYKEIIELLSSSK